MVDAGDRLGQLTGNHLLFFGGQGGCLDQKVQGPGIGGGVFGHPPVFFIGVLTEGYPQAGNGFFHPGPGNQQLQQLQAGVPVVVKTAVGKIRLGTSQIPDPLQVKIPVFIDHGLQQGVIVVDVREIIFQGGHSHEGVLARMGLVIGLDGGKQLDKEIFTSLDSRSGQGMKIDQAVIRGDGVRWGYA